jgi:signal transduction histidine kinase
MVVADDARLTQVFLNLLVNAAQAIPEGRADENVIRVRTRTDPDGRASIEVSDTGHGIPPEALPRIFDPFFTTKANGEGTGLGLSVVWGIVTKYAGTIDVKSVEGRGTRFCLDLPMLQPERSR